MKIVKLYPAENSKFHFGEFGLESEDYIFHSDSLFSSLVINYIRKHGNDKLNEFVNTFPRVSSLFYGIKTESKEVLFIPSYLGFNFGNLKEDDRKIIKKVKFVSINSVKNSANIAKNINSNIIYSKDDGIENKDFQLFYSDVEQKVCIDRETGSALKGGLYNISFIRLSENVFFYFLVDSDQISEDMRSSIETIRNFGLGGKISNGFGQIKEIKIEDFSEFNNLNGNKYVNLSVVFINKNEFENIERYNIIERKGWVYLSSKRKKNILGIKEGSLFKDKIDGKIIEEDIDKTKIYRYGKAFLVPVMVNE